MLIKLGMEYYNEYNTPDSWDDFPVTESSLQNDDPEDEFEHENLFALECEIEEAYRKRDLDTVDRLVSQLPPCEIEHKKTCAYIPPPQFMRVEEFEQGVFEPLFPSWQTMAVVIDKSRPSVASSLRHVNRQSVKWISPRKKVVIKNGAIMTNTYRIGHTPWKKQLHDAIKKLHDKSVDGSYKTTPCKMIMCGKKCKYGNSCMFAHTSDELSVRKCHFGNRCRFKKTCKFAHPSDCDRKTRDARQRMNFTLSKLNK